MKSNTYVGKAGRAVVGSALVGALLLTPKMVRAEDDHSGWSLNFTPALIAPHHGYGWGGGTDPELKYTIDRDGARLSKS